MRRLRLASILLAVPLAGLAGCARHPKPTPGSALADRTQTVAPPAVAAPAEADRVARNPLDSDDLAEINAFIRQQGLLGDVFFDFDRDELRPEAREQLAKNARFLADHPHFEVTVEGHCDDRGTADYNLALGDRRAAATRRYLESLGLGGRGLSAISYGEERPFCRDGSEQCWAQNRRAHFVVTGKRS